MRQMTPRKKHYPRLNFPPFSDILTECGRNIYSLFFCLGSFSPSLLFPSNPSSWGIVFVSRNSCSCSKCFPFFVQVLKRFGILVISAAPWLNGATMKSVDVFVICLARKKFQQHLCLTIATAHPINPNGFWTRQILDCPHTYCTATTRPSLSWDPVIVFESINHHLKKKRFVLGCKIGFRCGVRVICGMICLNVRAWWLMEGYCDYIRHIRKMRFGNSGMQQRDTSQTFLPRSRCLKKPKRRGSSCRGYRGHRENVQTQRDA